MEIRLIAAEGSYFIQGADNLGITWSMGFDSCHLGDQEITFLNEGLEIAAIDNSSNLDVSAFCSKHSIPLS